MPKIIAMQNETVGEIQEVLIETKNSGDSTIAIAIWFCVLFFIVGLAMGWILHQEKVKRMQRTSSHGKRRRSSRSSSTAHSGNQEENL